MKRPVRRLRRIGVRRPTRRRCCGGTHQRSWRRGRWCSFPCRGNVEAEALFGVRASRLPATCRRRANRQRFSGFNVGVILSPASETTRTPSACSRVVAPRLDYSESGLCRRSGDRLPSLDMTSSSAAWRSGPRSSVAMSTTPGSMRVTSPYGRGSAGQWTRRGFRPRRRAVGEQVV